MADLTQEQYEQLPEFVRDDYVEMDGVYRHGGFVKVKQTADALDAKLKAQSGETQTLKERLDSFEAEKAQAIEAARTAALEEARTKGDVEAIEQRYKEQMADLEARVKASTRAEVLGEISQERANEKSQSIVKEIAAAKAVDDDAKEVLVELLAKRVKVDPGSGKEIYLNGDGGASSLDRAGFIAEIEKEGRYKRLLKGHVAASGGGMASGGTGGSAATGSNAKAEAAKQKGDLRGFLAAQLNHS